MDIRLTWHEVILLSKAFSDLPGSADTQTVHGFRFLVRIHDRGGNAIKLHSLRRETPITAVLCNE